MSRRVIVGHGALQRPDRARRRGQAPGHKRGETLGEPVAQQTARFWRVQVLLEAHGFRQGPRALVCPQGAREKAVGALHPVSSGPGSRNRPAT